MAKKAVTKKKKLIFDVDEDGVILLQDKDIPESYEDRVELIRSLARYSSKHVLSANWNIGMAVDKIKQAFMEESGKDNTYGSGAVNKISEDTGVSYRLVSDTHRFYTQHKDLKKISTTNLDWSIFRTLLGVDDDKKRLEAEKKAEEENWTVNDASAHVKQLKKAETPPAKKPKDSKPNPRLYFATVAADIAQFDDLIKRQYTKFSEMVDICNDDSRVSEEEWESIKDNMLEISKASARVINRLNTGFLRAKDQVGEE